MPLLQIALVANFFVFFLMWKDKAAARKGQWRVPEGVLLLLTLLGGTPAMLVARRLFRHKTKKGSFVLRLYVIIAVQLVALIYFWKHGLPA